MMRLVLPTVVMASLMLPTIGIAQDRSTAPSKAGVLSALDNLRSPAIPGVVEFRFEYRKDGGDLIAQYPGRLVVGQRGELRFEIPGPADHRNPWICARTLDTAWMVFGDFHGATQAPYPLQGRELQGSCNQLRLQLNQAEEWARVLSGAYVDAASAVSSLKQVVRNDGAGPDYTVTFATYQPRGDTEAIQGLDLDRMDLGGTERLLPVKLRFEDRTVRLASYILIDGRPLATVVEVMNHGTRNILHWELTSAMPAAQGGDQALASEFAPLLGTDVLPAKRFPSVRVVTKYASDGREEIIMLPDLAANGDEGE